MLSKCANPACAIPFRYLHEGRIFNIPVCDSESPFGDRPSRVEHFWLCNACALTLKVVMDNGTVAVKPRHLQLPSRASGETMAKSRAASADSNAA